MLFECPYCNEKGELDDEFAHTTVICSACRHEFPPAPYAVDEISDDGIYHEEAPQKTTREKIRCWLWRIHYAAIAAFFLTGIAFPFLCMRRENIPYPLFVAMGIEISVFIIAGFILCFVKQPPPNEILIQCPHCSQIYEYTRDKEGETAVCLCGKSFVIHEISISEAVVVNEDYDDELCCPVCRSKQLTATKRGFSVGKAAVGGVLLGGVGLLGGLVGSNDTMVVCLRCGHKWQAGQHR